MFERFTEKAIKVITMAQTQAILLEHAQLHSEHIFLAILMQKSGIASKFLKAAGMNYEMIKEDIIALNFEKATKQQNVLPFSDELKKVLKLAWDKSIAMQNHSIIPEHLFLAIVESKNLNIIKLFNKYNIDIARIKNSTQKIVQKQTQKFIHPEFVLNTRQLEDTKSEIKISSLLEDEKAKDFFAAVADKTAKSNLEAIGTAQILAELINNKEVSCLFDDLPTGKEELIKLLHSGLYRQEDYDEEYLFTQKAKDSILNAFEIAKEAGSSSITPEHVLLGLLKNNSGSAYKILKEQNINTKSLKQRLMDRIEQQKTTSMKIIKLAKLEAARLGHNMVGSELLLLGIIIESAGIGAQVLQDLGVNIKDARKIVEELIGYGNNYEAKNYSLSQRAKKILDNAWVEAKQQNKDRIDSEHILLGIIKETDCVANKVLEALGVDAIEIVEGIKKKFSKI
ncbi:MAG: Clp protease N-terminal domain-containing protein [Candidatus Gastranaerophilales bacterium]|nr:Clp protease N-terminal domain-containing protein [Candidatus Gastranaerophilales bacterium]